MKISEILWKAANEHLASGRRWNHVSARFHSCDAVTAASRENEKDCASAHAFLKSLGMPYDNAFVEFKTHTKRQGARYAWLMFASMIAKEEGL